MNEKCKGNESFLDLQSSNSRLDKIRQEKLKRFRETISTKFHQNENDELKNEDYRTSFNLSWKDNGDFHSDEPDFQRYLRTLNASIFLRIKSSFERFIDVSIPNQFHYNEALVHLTHFQNLSSRTCLGFEYFIQNNSSVKQWIQLGLNAEHYPLLIIGSRASGKTLLATKLVQHLVNTLGKGTQCILRYFNLTTKSRHIVELFGSICSQMNSLQHGSTLINEQEFNRIDFYQSVLSTMSNNQKPLILMIDGIEEISPQNQQISSVVYYSTLLQLLPAKVGKIRCYRSTRRTVVIVNDVD